jgi:hypothetical protein
MKYQTIAEARLVGYVQSQAPLEMTKTERLERWAELLELDPGRKLNTLFQTEIFSRHKRDKLRVPQSAISVAFADPILRREGLRDDSYGEAKRFFEISDSELHWIVCYCHHGSTMSADSAARVVRGILVDKRWSLGSILGHWFGGSQAT